MSEPEQMVKVGYRTDEEIAQRLAQEQVRERVKAFGRSAFVCGVFVGLSLSVPFDLRIYAVPKVAIAMAILVGGFAFWYYRAEQKAIDRDF